MHLILASQSPRRRQLLEQLGLRFTVQAPDLEEVMDPALSPGGIVESLSAQKARAAAARAPAGSLILAADTVVALGDQVLGKPKDQADAARMLSALSGRRHQVYTGVTLLRDGRAVTEHERTEVVFRALSGGEISDYIATGEPMDKAGAYGIQGYGALLVERVEGDYFNVMGLPLCHLGRLLAGFGIYPLKGA